MKLKSRIFAVSFTSSLVLLGAAATASVFMGRDDGGRSLGEAAAAMRSMTELAANGPVDGAKALDALAPVRRDIARRTLLAQDRAVANAAAAALLVAAGALAAFAVSASSAAMLTARWERMHGKLEAIRSGRLGIRFGSGGDDEFGALESELDRLLDALDDRERMKLELRSLQGWGEASAFLAHQAKTPLASLVLSARTVREALADPESPRADIAIEASARAEAEAARLGALFSRVRSLSGFKDPEPTAVDPGATLAEAAAIAAYRYNTITPDSVSTAREGPGPDRAFDPAYLREAFANLLMNSAEACARSGDEFSASLTIRALPDRYELEYRDSVTGLDARAAAKVGTPRYTTKADGTGLGVWLVGRIAALHGGNLSVRLTERGGLSFLMAFPAGVAERKEAG